MEDKNIRQLLNDFDKVEIPIIQRDYAQGREKGKAPVVRENFINAIVDFLENPKSDFFHMDFIYGIKNTRNTFIPLDGQQRLTTLFLLHWYIGKKEQIKDLSYLKKFTYETRVSSREFCQFLTNLTYNPLLGKSPSEFIVDQSTYTSYWKKDPTIQSMLIMLDTIHEKLQPLGNVYEKLDKLQFSFPTEDLDISEDIYIKMNSRGKELSPFENFKARFEQLLGDDSDSFAKKIDTVWTDLFWEYKDKDRNDISKPFLRFFLFISEMLYFDLFAEGETSNRFYRRITPEALENDGKIIQEFYQLVEQIYFGTDTVQSERARMFLFASLDKLSDMKKSGIEDYFNSIFYFDSSESKTETHILLFGEKTNMFEYICQNSDTNQTNKLLFYFILISEFSRDHKDIFQVVRNLVFNNEDNNRAEYMKSQIHYLKQIWDKKSILDTEPKNANFAQGQIREEQFKEEAMQKYSEYISVFRKMENYTHFKGSIRVVFNVLTKSPTADFVKPEDILKQNSIAQLNDIFKCVQDLVGDNINTIRGELLIDDTMYKRNRFYLNHNTSCKFWNAQYQISSYLPMLIEYYYNQYISQGLYLIDRVRKFVKENMPLVELECPKKQIYTLYLVHTYINKKNYDGFFKNNNWQFGIYGDNDRKDYKKDPEILKMVKSSPFTYQTAIQLFKSSWGGGQPYLKQPTKKELQELEQL